MSARRHEVVIVGGGAAGISVAARLRRAGVADVAVVEPSDVHYYQPLWTLVGAGQVPMGTTARSEAAVMPKGVTWIRHRATAVDPEAHTVTLADDSVLRYQQLVLAPGIQLNFDAIPGLAESVGRDGVASNYRPDLAPRTWDFISGAEPGTAVFVTPPGPIKCAGAPQKIAYLAADHWRRHGLLDRMRLIMVLPTAAMFSQPDWGEVLKKIAAGYGIEVRHNTELAEVDGPNRRAVLLDTATGTKEELEFQVLHTAPPQSAPDWIRDSALADPESPYGYLKVDKHTLRHPDWPDVFALGDAANLPTSKTGAAIRKQAPVVTTNVLAARRGTLGEARYDGYTSCPVVTAHNRMLLAEFDYTLTPRPSFPFLDTMRPRYDMYLLKRYGLPQLYWRGMLRGRA
ncbi:NAD(P)/FAD-dependent oxidoreductase [Paractinoplanes brasiliensis]|uniref:Sulfide:quinone oxidoreductase n=1 Tax=Paractinoplanes brasiliensis TaxID=52695 RepID=A0A4R6K3Z9_9ACTN|nr:FAD/NAD(P)-binding oxidoreductase [Actinoplanes brasiliensis]TDO41975.1 sulfide:quinone oxidoreductase [Actinoplanes brasiliensis]GID29743.1 pyridine nucleotide-disulfide oxidoreductase [Actinoplanes brasiliensis]